MLTAVSAQAQYKSEVWVADQGDGTYVNPVLHADYSDPDACAVGDDFYLTASSFGCAPGLPILHSRDLVNWQIIGYALQELQPKEFFDAPQHGKGVWAPSIRFHNGVFYIYWGDPDWGIFMVKTTNPAGAWSEPVLVKAGRGMIDPCPLWDDDGKVYLAHAWAGSRAAFNSVITVCEMNAEGTAVVSPPVLVFDGNDGVNHTVEGAKFYKRNGFYYIMAPAGGVASGWQLVMRSKQVYGPYEARIVMAQGQTDINGPHQGAWVETNQGESWFLHFQDKGAYGRVLHLNPMQWKADWPVIGADPDGDGCGEPVACHKKPNVGATYPIQTPAESDEFNSRQLGLQWEWHANYQDTFGFTSDFGFMRLYGHILSENFVNFWEVPNLLLQKFPAEEFTATTLLKVSAKDDGQESGLIVMGWDYCRIGVVKQGEDFVLRQTTCHDAEQGGAETSSVITTLPPSRKFEAGLHPNYELTIYLRVEVKKDAMCHFSYSLDGKRFMSAGNAFKARQGKWIGAKVGLFSVAPHGKERGWLDADWFRVGKASGPGEYVSNAEKKFSPLDGIITCWIDNNYYPGASVAIADKDSILFQKYYGTYTPETEVCVASAGKWLSAATIAAVVDHTSLSWDDPVKKWIPQFDGGPMAEITLRQLLSHTSGIPDYHQLPKRDTYNRLDSAVQDILPLDTVFAPGTQFQYGGLAMQVAGRMAEMAGKADFETLFARYIAEPLGMQNTHYTPVDLAEGHSPMLAGGLRTTLSDYMRFLNMIFHDGMYADKRILRAETVREMQKDQVRKAHVNAGEYVEKALGSKHKGIYGLGEWREKIDAAGVAYQISSPGWAGAYPWIDKKTGVYGFFLTHVEGNAATDDGFSPFYDAPVLSETVAKVMEETTNRHKL